MMEQLSTFYINTNEHRHDERTKKKKKQAKHTKLPSHRQPLYFYENEPMNERSTEQRSGPRGSNQKKKKKHETETATAVVMSAPRRRTWGRESHGF